MGPGEHGRPRSNARLGQPVTHVKRCQQTKAGMMVLGVVPGEEDMTVCPRVLDRAETLREIRPVLERLELRLPSAKTLFNDRISAKHHGRRE